MFFINIIIVDVHNVYTTKGGYMELKKRIRHGWDISARGYSDLIQEDFYDERKYSWLDTILENSPQKDDMKILDTGCGPGFFSIILSEAGFDVTGIDLSSQMIIEAEKNAEAMETDAIFKVMDIQHPDFEDDTFDLIVSRNVVWSLSEPESAYKNWFRILKPGGRLLVFDGDHLKDLREPEGESGNPHDIYIDEYKKLYGKEPKCSYSKEDYEEARGWRRDLPLADKKRPEWDEELCKSIGFVNVKTEWVNEKVFTEKKDIYLHRNIPYFLLRADKSDV